MDDKAINTHLVTLYKALDEMNARVQDLEDYSEELTLALKRENPKTLALLQAGQKSRQALRAVPGYTSGYSALIQTNIDLIQGRQP